MDLFENIWLVTNVIRPLLDIGILAFLIYQVYKILVQTRAVQLIRGAFIVSILYLAAYSFQLNTILWIMNRLGTVLIIIIAVVFQPELRSIFIRVGRGEWFKLSHNAKPFHVDTVINAVEVLSNRRRGALIVFPRRVGIKNIIESGAKINAEISSSLILTIFGYDTPLHDGAIIVQSGKIISAGCFLPLSEQVDIRRSFGTRHRAALGIAEDTDSVTLVVSEETGALSLSYDANLYYDLGTKEIKKRLTRLLNFPDDGSDEIVEVDSDE
ncbi:MAG: diadenylate cyclase CdaA [Spirochaetales bacterium]|nr:diadenylate cyclase CdaA [Spirochaetales bacterium]